MKTFHIIFLALIVASCSPQIQESNDGTDSTQAVNRTESLKGLWKNRSEATRASKLESETKSLEYVISLVKAVEEVYPNDNWKVISAKIRKVHYNGAVWDLFLPGSIGIKAADTTDGVPLDVYNVLKAGNINFNDAEGNVIDATHIWTLIDALAHPDIDIAIKEISHLDDPAALSWLGDVGSVTSEYALGAVPSITSLEQYFVEFAGDADLNGDVDGYGMFFQSDSDTLSLSDRLKLFYTENHPKRFEYFLEATKLKLDSLDDKKVALSQKSIEEIEPQVYEFAFWWAVHVCNTNELECVGTLESHKIYNRTTSDSTVVMFADWFNERINNPEFN